MVVNPPLDTFYTTFESPVGPLLLMSDATSLTGLHTDNDKHRPVVRPGWTRDDSVAPFMQTVAQLRAYFHGKRARLASSALAGRPDARGGAAVKEGAGLRGQA